MIQGYAADSSEDVDPSSVEREYEGAEERIGHKMYRASGSGRLLPATSNEAAAEATRRNHNCLQTVIRPQRLHNLPGLGSTMPIHNPDAVSHLPWGQSGF